METLLRLDYVELYEEKEDFLLLFKFIKADTLLKGVVFPSST